MPDAHRPPIADPSTDLGEMIVDELDLDSNSDETEEDEDIEDAGLEATSASPPPLLPLLHLREISPLASWTVSTYKPGCGIPALLSPSPLQFWQSDGPQPHLLNIHFFKLVAIVKIRVYLDFELDESYTPTKMVFAAGMGMYDLTEFAEWTGEGPKGWVEVGLDGVGGGRDRDGEEAGKADVLRCMVVQVRVCENHQNGKDTHVRGVQIFARDERVKGVGPGGRRKGEEVGKIGAAADAGGDEMAGEEGFMGLQEPDWMGEPELR